MIFKSRAHAGYLLADKLKVYKEIKNGILIGLPRGGVVTAAVIAKALNLPLDVICPRKIRAPFHPELAIGAITTNDVGYLNEELIELLLVSDEYLKKEIEERQKDAKLRLQMYRKNKPPLDLNNKTVILVDDGLATGATMLAAISEVKKSKAAKVIVAIPVAHPDSLKLIEDKVDDLVCLYSTPAFYAVQQFYENFDQTEDAEVIKLLE